MLTKRQKHGIYIHAVTWGDCVRNEDEMFEDTSSSAIVGPDRKQTNEPLIEPTRVSDIFLQKGIKVGRRLLKTSAEAFPEDATTKLRTAYDHGVAMGTEICSLNPNHPRQVCEARLKTIVPPEPDDPLTNFQRGLFWLGASTRIKEVDEWRFVKREGKILGAKSQAELNYAFLNARPIDISRQFSRWTKHQKRSVHEQWLISYRGAIATARVANVFLEEGLTVINPTSKLDTENLIDLIVVLNGAQLRFLCIQIKNTHTSQAHSLIARHRHYLVQDQRYMLDHMEPVSKQFDLTCIPAFVGVSRRLDFTNHDLNAKTPAFREILLRLVEAARK